MRHVFDEVVVDGEVFEDRTGNLPAMAGIFPDYPAPIIRHGPQGWQLVLARWGNRAHLERMIGMVDGVAIISSAPPPKAYASIAMMAVAGRNGLIIETRPEQEIAWTNLVQKVRPDMPILLCTVILPARASGPIWMAC